MSTGLIGKLYKFHAPIPYIYDTVSSLSVVDCKYSYPQIVHMMLSKRTNFCLSGFVRQLFVHIHDTFTYGRISWMQQHKTVTSCCNLRTQSCPRVCFLLLPLLWGTTGDATFIHVENSVRLEGRGKFVLFKYST